MDRTALELNIEQLINSKQGDNNMLAIVLMQSQLGYSFSQACYKLKMIKYTDNHTINKVSYAIPILDYTISFHLSIRIAPALDYPYLDILRKVQHKTKYLNKYQETFWTGEFDSNNEQEMLNEMKTLTNLFVDLESLFISPPDLLQ